MGLKRDKSKLITFLPELLSFVIPVIVVAIAFFGIGIYPGSKYLVLTYDLKTLFLSLYGNVSNSGPGLDNIFYSMSGGLGGNYYGTYVLCVSPLDFVYSFCSLKSLPDAIYFMILFRIGLCGLFCNIFLRKNPKYKIPALMTVVLSCCYSLSSYSFAYFLAPMWFDVMMLLPLMALFTEDIIAGKKSVRFIAVTALCIICDYYIAYMCVLALIIYFFFRLTEEGLSIKLSFKRLFSFAIHGFISAGLTGFILVPVISDYSRGKLASETSVYSQNTFKFSALKVLRNMLPQAYSNLGIDQVPNIFCGCIVLLFVLIYLFNRKINVHHRIAAVIVLILYFCSFIISPIDRIWHGFRDPLAFPCRYSFTFCFFMICFAMRGVSSIGKFFEARAYIKPVLGVISMYTIIELILNGSFIVSKIHVDYQFVLRSEYERISDSLDTLLDNEREYSRIEKNYNYSSWDGLLFGYDGIEMFSSSYNDSLIRFLYALGIDSYYNHVSSSGLNPATMSLFDVGYYVSYIQDYSDCFEKYGEYKAYTLYKNPDVLPLCVRLNDDYLNSVVPFDPNPFDNINAIYSDIFGPDSEVFVPQEYDLVTDDPADTVTICFTPQKDGHYWFYRGVSEDPSTYAGESEVDYHRILMYSINGLETGEYGQFGYRYCADAGCLEAGEEYTLALDAPYTESGDIFLVYLDDDKLGLLASRVNGPEITKIDNREIVLDWYSDRDSDILLTLPYENGYNITVNGKKTDYSEYRNVLLKVHLISGENHVVIKFYPPGLKLGVLISAVFLTLYICLIVRYGKERKTSK